MRLHTLRLSAVGPFAAEQRIDFDRLGAGGLFLFEGPTGVGKSTILDALTFVLYGGLATASGDAARLRSDFADPDTRPEVQVEFSVRGSRHRLTRSPEYQRPKKRGSGFTKEKSSVHLERLEGSRWVSRSHAKDEVGTLVTDLVGLNREQFRQVVLLPQGEFATFLRAGDDERREVLSRLFGAGFFARVTDLLQQRAQAATRELQAADFEVRSCIAAACEAAGLEAQERADVSERPLVERLAELEVIEARLRAAGEQADARVRDAQGFLAGARRERAEALGICDRVERRFAVVARLAEAEATRAEHDARREAVARARGAAPIRPLVALADEADARVAQLRAELSAAPGDTMAPEHLQGRGGEELTRRAGAARRTAGELSHLVAIEADLPARRERAAVAARAAEQAAERAGAADRRSASLPQELAAAREALAVATGAGAGVEAAQVLLDSLTAQLAAATRFGELSGQVEASREARRTAARAHGEAGDLHDLLIENRLSDLSGQLASRLVSGDPCLVCGSPDHPDPAAGAAAAVTEEQIRAAATERDHARVRLDEAETALVRVEADLAHFEQVAGGATPEQCRSRIDEVTGELAAGERAQAELGELTTRVAHLAAEQEQVHAAAVQLAGEVAAARSAAELAAGDLADREERVRAGRGAAASVQQRADDCVAHADALEALAGVVHELSRSLAAASTARTTAAAEAREAGFSTLADARAAMMPPADLRALQAQVEHWEAELAAATAQLDSAELRAVVDVEPEAARAVLAAAELVVADAEQHLVGLQRTAALAARQVERFAERRAEVDQCAARRAELEASCADVVALDQYARGMSGSPRMSLVTFVLRYWFEQVVAAANLRLDHMSAGKYQLIRVDQGARRDARVGLGLVVLDRHTGRERSPATLSGGETFYTSLALALGLADVVVAQAGGAQLDTLFIDEGFGSLDPDTLDDVMGVIDDLRGNGRVVGIISHVPELKDRIAERLAVRRVRPDGPSTVEVRA
jgi:exonuclease SbcC